MRVDAGQHTRLGKAKHGSSKAASYGGAFEPWSILMKADRKLQEDVLAELAWDPSIEASRIGVEVEHGIVTLSGHVPSFAEKEAARRAAQRVSGVKGVAVDVHVVLPGQSIRTDADIAKS